MKALITGGGGFLGAALARRLLAEGASVRILARGRYPELEAAGCEGVQGDVRDAGAVLRACEGRDIVFHAAAKVGLWGRFDDFYQVNVEGTRNALAACRKNRIRRFVFTGSPSVVFDGRDCEGADESAPYPARYDSLYARTKALAEEIVLASNGPALWTVSLRPHLIWGPGDNHIIRRLIEKARAGRLRRIGGRNKRVDTTYIDDAADAHLRAGRQLGAHPDPAGKAYFISQGDARPIWDVINGFLGAAGLPPVEREASLWSARAAAAVYEAAWTALRLRSEPPLTRFMVSQLTTAHWFDISAARRDLGYSPSVTFKEGLRRLADWLKTAKIPA